MQLTHLVEMNKNIRDNRVSKKKIYTDVRLKKATRHSTTTNGQENTGGRDRAIPDQTTNRMRSQQLPVALEGFLVSSEESTDTGSFRQQAADEVHLGGSCEEEDGRVDDPPEVDVLEVVLGTGAILKSDGSDKIHLALHSVQIGLDVHGGGLEDLSGYQ